MNDEQTSLINDFVLESREHLGSLEPDLLTLENVDGDQAQELINRIFRSIHSIKGGSGFLNLDKINQLSHIMESLLMQMRDGKMSPSGDLIDALLAGVDRLHAMVDDYQASEDVDISNEVERLSAFMAEHKDAPQPTKQTKKSKADTPVPPAELTPSDDNIAKAKKNGQTLYLSYYDIPNDSKKAARKAADLLEQIESLGFLVAAEPNLADFPDDYQAQTGWLIAATVLETDLLAQALEIPPEHFSVYEVKSSVPKAAPSTVKPEQKAEKKMEQQKVEEKTAANAGSKEGTTMRHTDTPDTLRVNVNLLNNLMNLAGELVLGRNQLTQILTDDVNRIKGLNAVLQNLNLVTGELQENIMYTRMQPVGTVFNKFPRIVRDMSKKMGKEIELQIKGNEVELDKSIIEALSDPLTHLIRNMVDHGIETPDVREAAGKPRLGRALLRAYHEAGMVKIEVVDDGGGIDPAVILKKALQNHLVKADEKDNLTDREIVNLVFAPGFSTAKEVTDVSGRGVGMDVVKTNIEKLGGTVEIESTYGKGTSVILRLPLTLAIIPSLIIQVCNEKFAIPQVNIEELVRIRANETHKAIERVNGADVFRLRDRLLPLVRLADTLGIERTFVHPKTGEVMEDRRQRIADRRAVGNGQAYSIDPETNELIPENYEDDLQPDALPDYAGRRDPAHPTRRWHRQSAMTILVLKAGVNRYGLIVDNVHDTEEIVVKSLSKYLKGNPCFAGSTIMGNGRVAMILDAQGVAEAAQLRFDELEQADNVLREDAQRRSMRERQTLLLFRNGPAETFAMTLSLITRIEKIPVSEIEKIGNKEYIKYFGGSLQLLKLHDYLPVSKPEQEEVEFIYVIVPKLQQTQFGIIAMEVEDVVETDVEIDTGSIKAIGLLGSSIIKNNITLLLDIYSLIELVDPNKNGAQDEVLDLSDRELRILLAEDTPFFRALEKNYLESAGFLVDDCCDGVEALELLQKNKYDAVVTDLMMPNMDGFELVKRIRENEQTQHLPVLAVTSLADPKTREKSEMLGFTNYEVKLDKSRMLQKVQKMICSGGVQ